MRDVSLFGALRGVTKAPVGVSLTNLHPPAPGGGGWWPTVRESFPGAWQRNIELRRDLVLANWAVFSCLTLIASDIGKMRLRLVEKTPNNTWQETQSPAFSPVLRKPNRYQTRQKFIESWLISKLSHGNTYVLKERDARGVVRALYVLDPQRCKPLVAPDGTVYYALCDDWLAGLDQGLPAVPASEVIHDVMYALFHPLCGISPLFASSLAATQGLKIQENSAMFFANMSRPGGVLTAPGQISDDTAKRIKDHWDQNFGGINSGKVAVLGDDLKYTPMAQNAVDADLTNQLKLSGEMVCSTFHVPPFKVGMGSIPAGQKVGDLNQIYYSDCLQALIESVEALLDEGLGLVDVKEGHQYGTEFDLGDLLRMDEASQVSVLAEEMKGGWLMPDEARQRRGREPVPGGNTPYLQQQNFSLAALAKRDAREDPFATSSPPAPAPADVPRETPDDEDEADDEMKAFVDSVIARLAA